MILKIFLGNLLMLQDTGNKPGTFVFPFLQNHALWSLSYEWWFYMIFFPLIKLSTKFRKYYYGPKIYPVLFISVSSYISYLLVPNHLLLIFSYLVLWWSGVTLGEILFSGKKINFKSLTPIYISLFVMLLLSLIPLVIMNKDFIHLNVNDYPFIDFRHFTFALICIFFVNIYIVYFRDNKYRKLFFFSNISSVSYALYCVHFPILFLKISVTNNEFLVFLIKLIIIFVLSYILEIICQPLFKRYINYLFP